jgi:hypothetical protein
MDLSVTGQSMDSYLEGRVLDCCNFSYKLIKASFLSTLHFFAYSVIYIFLLTVLWLKQSLQPKFEDPSCLHMH